MPTFIMNRQAQATDVVSDNSDLLCYTQLEIRLSLALSCGSSLRLDELYLWCDVTASQPASQPATVRIVKRCRMDNVWTRKWNSPPVPDVF